MIDEIADEMEAAGIDISACLPMLARAVQAMGPPPSGLVIAAATPKGGLVIHAAEGWPEFDERIEQQRERFDHSEIASTVAAAIESPQYRGDIVMAGMTLLLGRAGLAAAAADAANIVKAGMRPLLVLLVQRDGPSVSTLITTVEMQQATIH